MRRWSPVLLVMLAWCQAVREVEDMCTSLGGPKCHLISSSEHEDDAAETPQQQDVKETRPQEAQKKSTWRERLVSVVSKHLKEGSRGRSVEGSFEVFGSPPDGDGKFHLKPGEWVNHSAETPTSSDSCFFLLGAKSNKNF